MPGSISVSVLEAFDLPETIAEGEDVAIKVAVGTREYQTTPIKAVGGKTMPWNLDFVFPVLNLRDNLLVMLLDGNGEAVSKNEINTPSIVEQGSFDVNLMLNSGGNVHLSLSFVLTEEERRRIDVMRAAALKRREQEALKLSASTQSVPVEGESKMRSSEPHLTPAAILENDGEKARVPEVSATALQEADVSQSEPVSQVAREESYEPTGKLDKLKEEHETNLHGSIGGLESITNSSDCGSKSNEFTGLDSGNQEPTGISDSTVVDNRTQAAADQMSGKNLNFTDDSLSIEESNSEDQKPVDLEKCEIPQIAPEENEELVDDMPDDNLKPTSNSVRAKIKVFEKTRPQGSTKQHHMLSPSSKIQKLSPQSKTPSRKEVEGEVAQAAKIIEPLHDVETTRLKSEPLEPANQMEGSVPNEILLMENVSSLETSKAGYTERKEKCLFETPMRTPEDDELEHAGTMDHIKSNGRNSEGERTSVATQKQFLFDEPGQSVESVAIQDGNREYRETEAEKPKYDETKTFTMQERKNFNLVGLSKQFLSGAVSGAILIAAGALLWVANLKRRNSSLRQRSKQRKRK